MTKITDTDRINYMELTKCRIDFVGPYIDNKNTRIELRQPNGTIFRTLCRTIREGIDEAIENEKDKIRVVEKN